MKQWFYHTSSRTGLRSINGGSDSPQWYLDGTLELITDKAVLAYLNGQ